MASTSSPCAACKFLRRKCAPECIFAPHFPPEHPEKFVTVHKVYGASNVQKILSELNADDREDAVKSLCYEAESRLQDPVYGSSALIYVLQNRVQNLQGALLDAHKELTTYQEMAMQARQAMGPAAFQGSQPSPAMMNHPAPHPFEAHKELARYQEMTMQARQAMGPAAFQGSQQSPAMMNHPAPHPFEAHKELARYQEMTMQARQATGHAAFQGSQQSPAIMNHPAPHPFESHKEIARYQETAMQAHQAMGPAAFQGSQPSSAIMNHPAPHPFEARKELARYQEMAMQAHQAIRPAAFQGSQPSQAIMNHPAPHPFASKMGFHPAGSSFGPQNNNPNNTFMPPPAPILTEQPVDMITALGLQQRRRHITFEVGSGSKSGAGALEFSPNDPLPPLQVSPQPMLGSLESGLPHHHHFQQQLSLQPPQEATTEVYQVQELESQRKGYGHGEIGMASH